MSKDNKILRDLRKDIFLTAYAGGMGHLASAYSCLEILYTLYMKNILKYNALMPKWENRDRLIMSKGHASLAVYNVLRLAGFFEREELWTFSQPDSRLGGEPNVLEVPGVEATTGSLGHGLSYGVGMALAKKIDNKSEKVYVIVGDGECQEGSIWEAVMSASNLKLNNLTVILDFNGLQKMGTIKEIMGISEWRTKWAAFGWDVEEVEGHDIEAIYNALIKKQTECPKVIIAKTIKGKGISVMENNPGWHWRMPSKRELKIFIEELGITEEELEQCKKHI